MVRPNTIIALGAVDHRPDYDYAENVTFRVFELSDSSEAGCRLSSPSRTEADQLIVRLYGQPRHGHSFPRGFQRLAPATRRNLKGPNHRRPSSGRRPLRDYHPAFIRSEAGRVRNLAKTCRDACAKRLWVLRALSRGSIHTSERRSQHRTT